MAKWYYAKADERQGPVDAAEIAALLQAGQITPATLVWRSGLEAWVPLREVGDEIARAADEGGASAGQAAGVAAAGAGMAVSAASGRVVPRAEALRYGSCVIAADEKALFVQGLREGKAVIEPGSDTLDGHPYGKFPIRAAAFIIDLMIEQALSTLATLPAMILSGRSMFGAIPDLSDPASWRPLVATMALSAGITILVVVVYETWMVGRYGGTLGKLALGLRVVNADGSRVSYLKALGRKLFKSLIDGSAFYLPNLPAAFDLERRAIHDHICATRVISIR
ncbi:MAG: RDD family protein [Verrucomicrobiales bacterium]